MNVGEVPSAGVVRFARSRPLKVSGPLFEPAWTFPRAGSSPSMLNVAGVNPRPLAQSCMWLWATNTFTIAALTSFAFVPADPGETPLKLAGLQPEFCHPSVQG